jgi:hypothetical protein
MKKVLTMVACFLMVFGIASFANAIPFTNTVNFSGTGTDPTDPPRDYLELSGSGSPFIYSYTHNVTFVPPAVSITSAEIILSHQKNSNTTTGELWVLYEGTSTQIGTLVNSAAGSDWVDQHFTLPSSLYSAISGASWSLALSLQENTGGSDKLWIDQSVLSGEYTPSAGAAVPEPATMLLLGSGLIGIGVFARRRFKK